MIGRLAADRFHVTTTTGGAARVLNMMEDYLQTEWPDLQVWLTSTTEQWATIARQRPERAQPARAARRGPSISSDAAFPHMSIAECTRRGLSRRGSSASASPASSASRSTCRPATAAPLWETLMEAGRQYDISPYGTETMHVLRAEKGYIIVGQDTDGTVTPDDAGLGWAIGKAKPDFVGKRSLARPDHASRSGRKQLVGLLTDDPAVVLEEGAQIVADPKPAEADEDARPRHLVLLERRARPLDRHGGGRRRPRAHGRDAARADARPDADRQGHRHGVLRPRRRPPEALTRRTTNERPTISRYRRVGPVTLTVQPEAARFNLRIDPAISPPPRAAFGLALPPAIGQGAQAGAAPRALPRSRRMGAVGAPSRPRRHRFRLCALYAETPHSLVEISDREIAVTLEGPQAATLLSVGCPADVERFAVRSGARTIFDGVQVVLCRDAPDRFTLEVWRSFVPHVLDLLETGNRELAAGL